MCLVEEVLSRIKTASLKAYCKSCPYPEYGYDNLGYYIGTGRAPTEFVHAINKLTDKQMITLVRKAVRGSTNDGIKAAKNIFIGRNENVRCYSALLDMRSRHAGASQ